MEPFATRPTNAATAGLKEGAAASPATKVQIVRSKAGVEAWLVENYTVPVISMDFAFVGGASLDPAPKHGLARLLAETLDEGAGAYDAQAYQERLEEYAIEISFDASKDKVDGGLRTLAENRDVAFEMLALTVNRPRFDEDAVKRVKSQMVAGLKRDENDPDFNVWRAFQARGFPNHPYGRNNRGGVATVSALSREDCVKAHGARFARDALKVAVVGAIDAERLGAALDEIFGALPAKGESAPIADAEMTGLGGAAVVPLKIPQTTLALGRPGLRRSDPDFLAAYVVNHVLGGGAFTSRLWNEVREKRGLAYSVWSQLSTGRHANSFLAGTATSNERAKDSLSIIQDEVKRMADAGPTADELDKAKKFLIGSYALRFDTSRKIAGNLVEIQLEDMGLDYIATRNEKLAAVTREDATRAARRLLGNGALLVAAAGKPVGIEES